jgi:hypothetical protein
VPGFAVDAKPPSAARHRFEAHSREVVQAPPAAVSGLQVVAPPLCAHTSPGSLQMTCGAAQSAPLGAQAVQAPASGLHIKKLPHCT